MWSDSFRLGGPGARKAIPILVALIVALLALVAGLGGGWDADLRLGEGGADRAAVGNPDAGGSGQTGDVAHAEASAIDVVIEMVNEKGDLLDAGSTVRILRKLAGGEYELCEVLSNMGSISMEAGTRYMIQEEAAPDGYVAAGDTIFELDESGAVHILNSDGTVNEAETAARVIVDGTSTKIRVIHHHLPVVSVCVQLVVDGRSWKESDEFEVAISPINAEPPFDPDSVYITSDTGFFQAGDGMACFGTVTLPGTGTYSYVVQQTEGDAGDLIYDTHAHVVTFFVTEDEHGNFEVSSTVAVDSITGEQLHIPNDVICIPIVEIENIYESAPSFEKKTRDINDSVDTESSPWQDSADYDIGDVVPFRLTAVLPDDLSDYRQYRLKFYDDMSVGLTPDISSFSVRVGGMAGDMAISMYHFNITTWSDSVIVDLILDNPHVFAGSVVEVYYDAILTDDAVIGGSGNVSEAFLRYSDNPRDLDSTDDTASDCVSVFTYKVNIDKVNDEGYALSGADFELYKEVNGEWISVLNMHPNGTNPRKIGYMESTSFSFVGLDDGKYRIVETTVPNGYEAIGDIEFDLVADHSIEADDVPELHSISAVAPSWGEMFADVGQGSVDLTIVNQAIIGNEDDHLTLLKHDADNENMLLFGALFELHECELDDDGQILNDMDVTEEHTSSPASDENGEVTFTNLNDLTLYYWIETRAPSGYRITEGEPHYFIAVHRDDSDPAAVSRMHMARELADKCSVVNEITVHGFDVADASAKWPVPNQKVEEPEAPTEKIEVTVVKEWNDADYVGKDGYERPNSVEVQLLADGEPCGEAVTLDDAEGWTHTWGELDKYRQGSDEEVEYFVREDAPDGYTYTVSKRGNTYTVTNTPKDDETITQVSLTIQKVDADTGEPLDDAEFTLVDADDQVRDVRVTNEGRTAITFTEDGTYKLKETRVPEGYIDEGIEYTIVVEKGFVRIEYDAGTGLWNWLYNLVFSPDYEDNTLTVPNKHESNPSVVRISKVDITSKEELPGATLQILDGTDSVVTLDGKRLEWTSTDEPKVIEGLPAGPYTLRETVAPDGYAVTADSAFAVNEDGSVTYAGETTTDDGNVILLVNDSKTRVAISKVDITSKEELPGATLQILDGPNSVVTLDGKRLEWTSTSEPKVIEGLLAGSYTLRETVAPEGYTIATDTKFTIDETGKVTSTGSVTEDGVILVEDAKTSIKVSKVDTGAGEEVAGATIQIIDSTGKVVEEWTSKADDESTEDVNEGVHTIEGLKTGEEYTLRETVAPEGYTVATDTKFTIDETGKVTSSGSVTEDGILLVEDDKTSVKVSKTDIAGGEELAGATIQIIDKDGNVVEQWTSEADDEATDENEGVHEIRGLKTGEEYTLRETVAPEGYAETTDSIFIIAEDGSVSYTGETATDDDGNKILLVNDSKTRVVISKVDITSKEELPGATLQILDGTDSVVVLDGKRLEWTSTGEPKVIEGLPIGSYTLRETVAPAGYAVTTDSTFAIAEDGSVTYTGETATDDDGNVILLVNDSKTKVAISKVDITSKEELPGATLQVLDSKGEVVEQWVSTKETHTIEGLKTGETYILCETVAPEGYTVATDTTFTINETGNVTSTGSTTTDDEGNTILLVEDAKTKVSVSKIDIANGEELEGAHIQILDSEGNVVEEWDSTKAVHEIEGLKTGVTYTLRETVAPEGYTVATDTTFTINETGNVTSTGSTAPDADDNIVLLVEDAKTHVSISKIDIADGKELEGAHIQILDSNGNVVEEWVSTKEAHTIEGLKTKTEYTLHETIAPDGYAVATDTTFTIDEHNKVTTTGSVTEDGILLIEDAKTKVSISKVDIADGEELEGAHIQILDSNGNVVEEWDSTKAVHEIEGLKTGVTYTLRETVAPTGYEVATDNTFNIATDGSVTYTGATTTDTNGNQILLVEDSLKEDEETSVVRVSKVDITSQEELPGATLQVLDGTGAVVTLDGNELEWTSTGEPKVIEGLPAGTYTLRETVAPTGYAIATDNTFTIAADGSVTYTGATTTDTNGNKILLVQDSLKEGEDEETSVVRISKVDITSQEELPGATLQVLNGAGAVVTLDGNELEWTSTGEPKVIEGLPAGTYTLRETVAPTGYAIATDSTFTVAADGSVTYTGATTTDTNGNKVLLVNDSKTRVEISKVDITGDKEVPGATLSILDQSGKVIEKWVSTDSPHVIEGVLVAGQSYTLHEVNAPDGYAYASDITFTVSRDGKTDTIKMVDEVLPKESPKDDDGTANDAINDKPDAGGNNESNLASDQVNNPGQGRDNSSQIASDVSKSSSGPLPQLGVGDTLALAMAMLAVASGAVATTSVCRTGHWCTLFKAIGARLWHDDSDRR